MGSCRFSSGIASSCSLQVSQANGVATVATQRQVPDALHQPVAALQADYLALALAANVVVTMR